MSKEDLLSCLTCALSIEKSDKHFFESPVQLSCGHCACKKCIPKCDRHTHIKCLICGETNKFDLSKKQKLPIVKQLVRKSLDELFNEVRLRLTDAVSKLKQLSVDIDKQIDTQIDIAQNQLLIRIEQMKSEIDISYSNMRHELNEIKNKCKLQISNQMSYDECDCNNLDMDLKNLSIEISTKSCNLNERSLYAYQDKIKHVNKLINDLSSIHHEIRFNANNVKLDSNFIGYINHSYGNATNIWNRVKSGQFEYYEISSNAFDLCVLPNYLLLANYNDSNLTLYDKNFKLIKTVDKIDEHTIKPICVDTNGENEIYIVDCDLDRIIKTDLNFNQLAAFGKKGSGLDELNSARGISYHNHFLYVCDVDNKRVQKLDSNLTFKESYLLDFKPWYIKTAHNIACIRSYVDHSAIYFYDLATFTLKIKYDDHNGLIGVIDSHFFEYYPLNKKIYCYDENGKLIEESKETSFFGALESACLYGGIAFFNGKLIICSQTVQKAVWI